MTSKPRHGLTEQTADAAVDQALPDAPPAHHPHPDPRPGEYAVPASWVQSLRMFSATRADQRALHDWLNPAASRAAMDGSLAADFSASISR